jgi:hypothetical protein
VARRNRLFDLHTRSMKETPASHHAATVRPKCRFSLTADETERAELCRDLPTTLGYAIDLEIHSRSSS